MKEFLYTFSNTLKIPDKIRTYNICLKISPKPEILLIKSFGI